MPQTQNLISNWYEFAIQQVFAESYLDTIAPDNILPNVLQQGNNRGGAQNGLIRLTPSQVASAVARYEIISHAPNDASGFSATLLKDNQTGEYTLAFRSTAIKGARLD